MVPQAREGENFARVMQREKKRAIAHVFTAGHKTPCLPPLKVEGFHNMAQ